jgi:hypothetical protein
LILFFIGAFSGFMLGNKFGDSFARWLFGVETPQEALVAAYAFLGVPPERYAFSFSLVPFLHLSLFSPCYTLFYSWFALF